MEFKYPIVTKYVDSESTKIPRPANAFMLYANHNRKKIAQLYPLESNKEISKRLGTSWKELDSVEKLKYYDLAKKVDAEHKKKYPDYVYNPKEARIRKAMREASRERAMGVLTSPRGGARRNIGSNHWNFEDQMMMSPHNVRMMGSPMCTSPGFNSMSSNPNSTGGGFMPSLHYPKHPHAMNHPHPSHNFIQNNRIPHQEMWHPYEEMRSPGPYIISPPQLHGYQQQQQHQQPPQQHNVETFRGKPKAEVEAFPAQEPVVDRQDLEKLPMFENKLDSIQPLETEIVANEPAATSFDGNYNNKEEIKPKKIDGGTLNLSLPYVSKPDKTYLNGSISGSCSHTCCPSNSNCFTNEDYDYINPTDVNDIYLLENYNPNFSDYQEDGEVLNLCTRPREQQ